MTCVNGCFEESIRKMGAPELLSWMRKLRIVYNHPWVNLLKEKIYFMDGEIHLHFCDMMYNFQVRSS